MSFDTMAGAIITTLNNSSAIAALLSGTGKSLIVRKGFKPKSEIHISELPVAMILRPGRKITIESARQYENNFVLLVGIHCENRESAPGQLDNLENAIEDSLVNNFTLSGAAVDLHFVDSANDMGKFHPVYFTSMQFNVSSRK